MNVKNAHKYTVWSRNLQLVSYYTQFYEHIKMLKTNELYTIRTELTLNNNHIDYIYLN